MSMGVLCEPFSCIVRGFENMEPIRSDSSILVCGAGEFLSENFVSMVFVQHT